jgi:hypothetical protein
VDQRLRLYVAGTVAATAAYLFTAVAFTGQFAFVRAAVFVAFFLAAFAGFEAFVSWAGRFES